MLDAVQEREAGELQEGEHVVPGRRRPPVRPGRDPGAARGRVSPRKQHGAGRQTAQRAVEGSRRALLQSRLLVVASTVFVCLFLMLLRGRVKSGSCDLMVVIALGVNVRNSSLLYSIVKSAVFVNYYSFLVGLCC